MSDIGRCTSSTFVLLLLLLTVLGYYYASNIVLEEYMMQVSFGLTTLTKNKNLNDASKHIYEWKGKNIRWKDVHNHHYRHRHCTEFPDPLTICLYRPLYVTGRLDYIMSGQSCCMQVQYIHKYIYIYTYIYIYIYNNSWINLVPQNNVKCSLYTATYDTSKSGCALTKGKKITVIICI